MELRLLTTEAEKQLFAERMTHARVLHNLGFRENPDSCVGRIHLQFGRSYALFEDNDGVGEMVAGFVMHDLASFPQSYPAPDFSRYAPERVYEVGEMWSLARRAGTCVLHGMGILFGLLQAQAGVGYAIVKPWDLRPFYRDLVPVGEAIEWPYARTLEGGKIFCQAVVAEGEHLRAQVTRRWAGGFETCQGHTRIKFPEPGAEAERPSLVVASKQSEEANGVMH